MSEPRIVLFDIETAPNLGYTWGKWEQNVIEFTRSWYLLSFAVKTLGDKRVKTYALPDYPGFKRDKENDKALTKELWKMMNEADIVVAHNGDNFDIKKANARFICHGLEPPAPYKTIDTLKVARRHFKFDSNKLDELGAYLKLGRKLPHTGFHLWKGCMTGDDKSWRLMRRYNARDVELLEKVYLKLRPWMTNHPNLNLYTDGSGCPSCKSNNIQRRGVSVKQNGKRFRFQCQSCASWFYGAKV